MATSQNTLIMMPGEVLKSTSIKPAHISALVECSKVTGWPLRRLLNEALSNYIEDYVPVLMQATKGQSKQRV